MANGNGKGKRKGTLSPGKILGAAIGGLVGVTGGLPALLMGSAVGYGISSVVGGASSLADDKKTSTSTHARRRSSARKRSTRR